MLVSVSRSHFQGQRHPVRFYYMLGGIILDGVDTFTDLRVGIDSRMRYSVLFIDFSLPFTRHSLTQFIENHTFILQYFKNELTTTILIKKNVHHQNIFNKKVRFINESRARIENKVYISTIRFIPFLFIKLKKFRITFK
jgi:hypothetical protein